MILFIFFCLGEFREAGVPPVFLRSNYAQLAQFCNLCYKTHKIFGRIYLNMKINSYLCI